MSYELFFGSFSDNKDEVNSELAFFTDACTSAIEASKPKRTRNQVPRDRYGAHDRLVAAYFSEHPQYEEATFRMRFRMSRRLFTRMVQEISDHYPYFQVHPDFTGRIGISVLVKCTSAICQMTYDTVPDALYEYPQMGATTPRDNLVHFCNAVMELYGHEYLRQPTYTDMEKLYVYHEENHGFPGMIRSIDCTDWPWENCPHAFKAQFCRGDHGSDPFILLEALASQDLWIWHAIFGVSRMNNDVNVLRQSPIFNDLKIGKAPDIPFVANDVAYSRGY
ncbi:putative nuclease HARBI1 [Tanacetum coccineum]|uniref:Nuclease HARBI1 n=1 Tax=Tanacetum coccineum TaxID=301880 RepID=A0ABQ5H8Z7_9ASTR